MKKTILLLTITLTYHLVNAQSCGKITLKNFKDTTFTDWGSNKTDGFYFDMIVDTLYAANTGYATFKIVDKNYTIISDSNYMKWGRFFPYGPGWKSKKDSTRIYMLFDTLKITTFPKKFEGFLVSQNPKCTLNINHTTSILKIVNKSNIKLYPIPANNILTITGIKNIGIIKVYSLNGKILKTIYNRSKISVIDLKVGTYIIGIKAKNQTFTYRKIVKE